jgi:hypothetical protein
LVPIDASLPPDTAVGRVVKEWNDSLKQRLGPEQTVGNRAAPIDPMVGCEEGDGYKITEAGTVCTQQGSRTLQAGNTNPG